MARSLTGLSGIVFLLFIAVLLTALDPNPPGLGASPTELQRYHVDDPGGIRAYLTVFTAAMFFLTWFLGSFVELLREAEQKAGPRVSAVALTGAVIGLVAASLTIMFEAAAAFRPEETAPELTRLLWDLSYLPLAVLGIGFAVFLTAAAVGILRTGILPKWLGWLTVAPAVLNALWVWQIWKNDGYVPFEPFLAFVLWTLITSITLLFGVLREGKARGT